MSSEVQAGLTQLDIARSIFSAYCGIPATRLGMYLDGAKVWDPVDLAACRKTLHELIDLTNSVDGLPIDWRRVGQVRAVLDARRERKTWVVETSSGYFLSLDRSYRPVFDGLGVALKGEAAHSACSELRKLNFQNVKAVQRTLVGDEKPVDFHTAWRPR